MVTADADLAVNAFVDVSGVIEHCLVNVRPVDGRERDALELVNKPPCHTPHSSRSMRNALLSSTIHARIPSITMTEITVCVGDDMIASAVIKSIESTNNLNFIYPPI
jgi:hypothetical protein